MVIACRSGAHKLPLLYASPIFCVAILLLVALLVACCLLLVALLRLYERKAIHFLNKKMVGSLCLWYVFMYFSLGTCLYLLFVCRSRRCRSPQCRSLSVALLCVALLCVALVVFAALHDCIVDDFLQCVIMQASV